jgi:hypothetical protein
VTVTASISDRPLYPEELIAIVLLSTEGGVSDLSQKLLDLKKHNVDIGFIALRSSPDGVYSEDIDTYISFLLTFDYATARSPIKLTEKGKSLCAEIVKNAFNRNPDIVNRIASVLAFNIKKLTK